MSSFVPRAAYRKQTVHDPLQNGSSRQLSITLYYHQSSLTATAEWRLFTGLSFTCNSTRTTFSKQRAHISWHVAKSTQFANSSET